MRGLAIWRYPVKAMLGEPLDATDGGLGGCAGDRRWVVVDAGTCCSTATAAASPRMRSSGGA
jgi:uncharacterized protein YcbX